jgi:HEAT repeat protein
MFGGDPAELSSSNTSLRCRRFAPAGSEPALAMLSRVLLYWHASAMSGRQLDLFSADGGPMECPVAVAHRSPIPARDLDDAALIAAIPGAARADAPVLTEEAGRRGLGAAIPALDALCRRFSGFGVEHAVPEQRAALEALAVIGGAAATQTVARMIEKAVVQGPTLKDAIDAAAHLQATLQENVALVLLKHADPAIRANTCRCVRPSRDVVAVLIDLLDDLNGQVRIAAACALGRMGRPEARIVLMRLLREQPALAVIDAIAAIADDECLVLLGRIARDRQDLAPAVLDALDGVEHPLAARIVAAIQQFAERR